MSTKGSRHEPVVGHVEPRSEAVEATDPSFASTDTSALPSTGSPSQERSAPQPLPSGRITTDGKWSFRGSAANRSTPRSRNRRTLQSARLDGRQQAGENSRNRWLVSYADFMTLLLGFFVVMYAISSVNEEKYQQMSKTFAGIFENSSLSMAPIQAGDPVAPVPSAIVDVATDTPPDKQAVQDDPGMLTSPDYVANALGGIVENKGLNIAANENWLEISLDSEISFAPDSAALKPEAMAYLQEIRRWLGSFENPVTVEGYTDNVPVNGRRFTSNWQLSSARAASVAENLTMAGINAERVSAVGYGENHPVATNASPQGRAKNRRVVIVVAHKGNLPRNLNAASETSAFALVRHADDQVSGVPQRRTAKGGLLFSNE